MKLPGPGTHFHHNEPKLNRDWMLFSSEIEGDLCAMLEVSAWDFILNNTLAKEWMMRTAYPVCISTMFNLQKLSHGYDL